MRVRNGFRFLFLLLPWFSCAHTEVVVSGAYTTQAQVITVDDRGEAVPVPAGQALRSGQVFALTANLARPAHVYIIHRRGGMLANLYPGVSEADAELSPGLIRLPGHDAFMRVPALEHQSRICVLFSARPLGPERQHCPTGAASNRLPPDVQALVLTAY